MGDELIDVRFLLHADEVAVALDLNVQKIRNLTFIFDFPTPLEIAYELGVSGMRVIVRISATKVVHIAAEEHLFFSRPGRSLGGSLQMKNARVVVRLNEALFFEPGKEGALPAPPTLGHAINWLFDAKQFGLAIFANTSIALGHRTVNHFTGEQLTLKISSHKIPPAHAEAEFAGAGGKETKRGDPHGGTKGLIIVHAGPLECILGRTSGL